MYCSAGAPRREAAQLVGGMQEYKLKSSFSEVGAGLNVHFLRITLSTYIMYGPLVAHCYRTELFYLVVRRGTFLMNTYCYGAYI